MITKQQLPRLLDNKIDIMAWLQAMQETHELKKINLLEAAIKFIESDPELNVETVLEQGLITAEILLNLKCDQESAAAAILLSTMQSSQPHVILEKIKQTFGESITKLIHSAQQINILSTLKTDSTQHTPAQIDRLRKIFLVMAADIRVVIMKLAERLAVLRQIKSFDPIEQKKLAQETLDIYAPLANRLGIGQLKWELEDIAFHYTQPEVYKKIAGFLAEKRIDREQHIDSIVLQLKACLDQAGLPCTISGRAKHIYSIYLKTQKKNLDYEKIYDYSAVRILVPTITDCYTALSLVSDLWEQLPEEFADYIARPKPNGYRSIHLAVRDNLEKHLEIQIRTDEMHQEAEKGVAAHWIYKEDKDPKEEDKIKMDFLRELVAWQAELTHENRDRQKYNPEKTFQEVFSDRIYVLTPTGDILDLVVGATPLDFAYLLHSDLGHRCRGSKVNGQIVPLTHRLQTGDRVEIMALQGGKPSPDWLIREAGYIASSHARKKILQWFRRQHHPLKNTAAATPTIKREPRKTSINKPSASKKNIGQLKIEGVQDALWRIAKCCQPEAGEHVVGYITQGNGVSIHQPNCKNIFYLKHNHKERFIKAEWV